MRTGLRAGVLSTPGPGVVPVTGAEAGLLRGVQPLESNPADSQKVPHRPAVLNSVRVTSGLPDLPRVAETCPPPTRCVLGLSASRRLMGFYPVAVEGFRSGAQKSDVLGCGMPPGDCEKRPS